MKITPNLEADIKSVLKEILFKALLPQTLKIIVYVLLNWSMVSLWLYLNYEEIEGIKLLIITLLGGVIPIFAYGICALRKFIIKAFLIIHNRILKHWLNLYCAELALKVKNGELLLEKNLQSEIVIQFKIWITKKIENLPVIIKKVSLYIIRKIGYSDSLEEKLKSLNKENADQISVLINEEFSRLLIESSHKIIPYYVIFLIPVNIILLIGLWFY